MDTASLPVLPADLTFVRVNGGRGFAQMVNWDYDDDPQPGQHVVAADGGSGRLEAVIVDIRDNGTIVLEFPGFARPRAGDG
jgi:hypothetical protein